MKHFERVAGLPCVICKYKLGQNTYAVEVHHVGHADQRSDYLVAPLCAEHHRGSTGVHGLHRRAFDNMWKVDDLKLLSWTQELLCK